MLNEVQKVARREAMAGVIYVNRMNEWGQFRAKWNPRIKRKNWEFPRGGRKRRESGRVASKWRNWKGKYISGCPCFLVTNPTKLGLGFHTRLGSVLKHYVLSRGRKFRKLAMQIPSYMSTTPVFCSIWIGRQW